MVSYEGSSHPCINWRQLAILNLRKTMTVPGDEGLMEKLNQAVTNLIYQHNVCKEDQGTVVKRIQCLTNTATDENGGFPMISSAVLSTGCACLLRLIILEYRNYSDKASSIGGRKGVESTNFYNTDWTIISLHHNGPRRFFCLVFHSSLFFRPASFQ
jgi:hypothetical protein